MTRFPRAQSLCAGGVGGFNERLLFFVCLSLQFLATTLQREELQDTRLKTAWKRGSTVPKVNHAVHQDAVKCGDEVERYHVGKCEKSVHVNAEFFKVCLGLGWRITLVKIGRISLDNCKKAKKSAIWFAQCVVSWDPSNVKCLTCHSRMC